jgi:hypothetical protein
MCRPEGLHCAVVEVRFKGPRFVTAVVDLAVSLPLRKQEIPSSSCGYCQYGCHGFPQLIPGDVRIAREIICINYSTNSLSFLVM